MYNSIIRAVLATYKDADIDFVIPSGSAIQNGRTSSLGDSFNRDGIHLELTYG